MPAKGKWNHWAGFLAVTLFVAVFYWLNGRQYLTFQVRSPDVDRFSQAIWNTLQGRFLYSTIKDVSILSNHFTPYMALLSPLLLVWADVRILYLAQILGLAATGLLLYRVVYDRRPSLALWVLLAFLLNPALHRVALFELRRVTLAMPFLALIIYGLYFKKRRWMLLGVIFALLCKEEVGILVFGVGLFLLLVERDWKWGIALTLLGPIWTVGMLNWVIPAIGKGDYPQISYYAAWGDSFRGMLINMLSQPARVWRTMFDQASLQAIWQLLLPVAFVLPFLAAEYFLICLPLVAAMLLSSAPEMHALQRWYLASVLPFLFAAVGVGLGRIPEKWATRLTVVLMATTVVGYGLYSPAPLGGRFEPDRYQFTERDEKAWELVRAIPDEAKVAAQVAFTTQLAHREYILVYPWLAENIDREDIDYFIVGENYNSWPIPAHDLHWEIMNLLADPDHVVEMEADGVYLLHQGGEPLPSIPVNQVAESSINLDRVEVAVADRRGFFQTVPRQQVVLETGQQVRITLYWKALAVPHGERTVSIRIADATGALIAQMDMKPGEGSRPTSWWEPGWYFRDVYYLTVAQNAVSGAGSLDLLLYDSYTLEHVPFDNGEEILLLAPVTLVE